MKSIKLTLCFFLLLKLSVIQANVRDLMVSGITTPENANGTYVYQGVIHIVNLIEEYDTHLWMNAEGNYIFWGDYGGRYYWFIDNNNNQYDDGLFYLENSDEFPPFSGYVEDTYGTGNPLIKYAPPKIETVSYDCNSNVLSITGTNYIHSPGLANDVDVSKITITGEGGFTYSFQNLSDIEITSINQISFTLTGLDLLNVEALLNKNGVLSADNSIYNFAVEDDWMPGYEESSDDISDMVTAIDVSAYVAPQIISASYHAGTRIMTVAGSNFVVNNNGVSDIDITKFSLSGGNNGSFTFAGGVEITLTSDSEFSFMPALDDQLLIDTLLNKNGLSSLQAVVYNIAAQDDWLLGAPLSNNISDLSGNPINVTNIYSLSTNSVIQTDPNFITAVGNVEQIGTTNPLVYGFCWNTGGSPTILDHHYDIEETCSTGSYSALITTFLPETTYAVRAYMLTPWDCIYGNEVSIATLPKLAEPGNALSFDGIDDYVLIDKAVIPAVGDFTVEVWFNADTDMSGFREILSQDAGNGGEDFYIGMTSGGNIRAGDDWVDTGIGFPADGRWHHIAITKSNAATTLYLDGLMLASNTTTVVNPMGTNFRIGRQYGLYNEYFKGKIDELRVWNTERSANEITENMIAVLNGNEDGLVAYYNFNSGITAGTNTIETLVDITQNGHQMSLTNFTLSGSTSNWVESYAMVVPIVSAATKIDTSTFTMNWEAPLFGVVENYLLELATDSAFTDKLFPTISADSDTKHINFGTFPNGTSYYFRIRANKASVAGQGAWSNTIKTTTSIPVVVPVDLAVADTTIVDASEACFNAENEITVAGSSDVIVENNASANFIAGYSVTFLPGFHAVTGSYMHAFITENDSFCDDFTSLIVAAPVEKSLVDEDVVEPTATITDKAIKVYPNPNNGHFTLELENIGSGANVSIYNMLGAVVYTGVTTTKTTQKVNLEGIKRGMYIVKLIDHGEQLTKKMIVN